MKPESTESESTPTTPIGEQLSVEKWECRACGHDAPCRVEITHQPTKYPDIESQPRFTTRNRGCICDNSLTPDWIRLPDAQGEARPHEQTKGKTMSKTIENPDAEAVDLDRLVRRILFMKHKLEIMREIWPDHGYGEYLEIGPDRDGTELVEIRQKEPDGKISARISVCPDAARLLANALTACAEELSPANVKVVAPPSEGERRQQEGGAK